MPRQYHIIVADDDPLFLFLMQQALAIYFPSAGLTTVRSAEDAIVAFSDHGADLLVTDQHMPPGMSGLELVTALRACDVTIPIVVVSSDYRVEQDALDAGADAFVLKDGVLEALVQVLAGLLHCPAPQR